MNEAMRFRNKSLESPVSPQKLPVDDRTIRMVVFLTLLVSSVAFAVKCSLEAEARHAELMGFVIGLCDALVVVGFLYACWKWTETRYRIHATGKWRIFIFGMATWFSGLLAVGSWMGVSRELSAPAWMGLVAFCVSLGLSLSFLVPLFLIWNIVANKRLST